jgi:hypothetical protein
MDQVVIATNLACYQYIRFKTLSYFFSFKMGVVSFGSNSLQFFMFHLVATKRSFIYIYIYIYFMVYIYLKSVSKICVTI